MKISFLSCFFAVVLVSCAPDANALSKQTYPSLLPLTESPSAASMITMSPVPPAGTLSSNTLLPFPTNEKPESQTIPVTSTIKCPRTILFYGDSRLGALGISFVENIKKLIDPCYNLINASFWAHTAIWGAANLQNMVISKNPDEVALWWGANDFNGCNGTTDPVTNLPDKTKFNARLTAYLSAMKSQIETLSDLGKPVYVFDEPRVSGGLLPWAIEDDYGNVTRYDYKHLCSWDWVSDAVAQAQKNLVADERTVGRKVILVDVWQLYIEYGTLPDMYSNDVVHPGSLGREKIADLFIKAFQDNP